ncbi:MAG: porin [Rubrivivax sp.]|nr:porin [Rubrivivax sp.]MDP3613139.1 porin [Rubrivivax sp.]
MITLKQNAAAVALGLAAATGASAQTGSVTLYGRVDLNVTRISGEGWRMDQSSTSRFGLRGSESLGGGMSAIFQLESRINPQNGTAESPRFWGRESWLGLRGGFGTFRMGRTLSPSQRIASNYDPHGTDGIGSFGSSGLLLGHPSATFVRMDNGLYYETPNFSGFSVFGAFAMDDTPGTTDERFHSIRLRYAKGPLDISLGLGELSDGNDVNSFGAAYDLGFMKPMVQFHSGKRAGRKRASWLAGATAPVASGELRAAYSKQDDRGNGTQTDRTLLAVGYDYPLSKRTLVYGTVIRDKTDRQDGKSGMELGLRHSF